MTPNTPHIQYFDRTVGIASLLMLLSFVLLKCFAKDLYVPLIREDNVLEYAQSAMYLVTALLAAITSWQLFRKGHSLHGGSYIGLALAMFLIGMEEISWGHSLLNLELPQYMKENNVQGDLTLHNLESVQPFVHTAYMLVGLFGAFAAVLVPRRIIEKRFENWWLYLPRPSLFFCFFTAFALYALIEYGSPYFVEAWGLDVFRFSFKPDQTFFLYKDQEVAETLLAFGFLAFTMQNLLVVKRYLPSK